MVTLTLKELFENNEKNECSKWYTLRFGVGCGKVRLSFLYKALSMKLFPKERGYDVGTLMIYSIKARDLDKSLKSKIFQNIYIYLYLL